MSELCNKGSTPHKIGAQRGKLAEFIKCSGGIKTSAAVRWAFNVKNNPWALWSVLYVVGGVKGGLYIGSCRDVEGIFRFPQWRSRALFLFHVTGASLESLRQ